MKFEISDEIKKISDDGMSYAGEGMFFEAIECFDEGLEIDSKNPLLIYNKAGCLMELGQFDEAHFLLQNVIILCSEYDSELMLNLKANSYIYLDDLDKADECFDEILKEYPNNVEALIFKGRFYDNEGRYLLALKCFDKVIKEDPLNAEAHMYKGETLYDMGKYQRAVTSINRAFDMDKTMSYVWYLKALCAWNILDDFDKAIFYFDRAIELDCDVEIYYFNRASCLLDYGHVDEAKESFIEAFELSSMNDEIESIEDFFKILDI